jgi:membrane protein YqaA with SNARE-associated domain
MGLFVSVVFLELVPQFLSPYLSLLVSIPSLGVERAVIISVLASILGCILGFEIGRKYGFKFICPFFEEKTLKKILNFWGKYGKWFVLAAAFTPLPDAPLIYGAFGMSRRDFIIYGVITKAISFIFIGYAAYYGFFNF